jgi:hypothetical protein
MGSETFQIRLNPRAIAPLRQKKGDFEFISPFLRGVVGINRCLKSQPTTFQISSKGEENLSGA